MAEPGTVMGEFPYTILSCAMSGAFPCTGRRLQLLETRVLDDSVLLTYRLGVPAATGQAA
jgi:hypothetical protein